MSRGKWQIEPLRGIVRKGRVYQLRLLNSPSAREATGKRWAVYSLGPDLSQAIKLAAKIRRGDLPSLEDQIASEHDADLRYHIARAYADRITNEQEAVAFFKKATRQDATYASLIDDDGLSLSTIRMRRDAVARCGLVNLSDCTTRGEALRIVARLKAKGVAGSTLRMTMATLGTLWRIAADRELVSGVNPFAGLRLRSVQTLKRPITLAEARLCFLGASQLGQALIVLLLLTGCRISEALAIVPSDIHGGFVVIRGTKTKASVRRIALSASAEKALCYVMAARPDYFLAYKQIKAAFKTAGLADGTLDVHSFRRGCARLLAEAQVEEYIAAYWLAHVHRVLSYTLYGRGPPDEALRETARRLEDLWNKVHRRD